MSSEKLKRLLAKKVATSAGIFFAMLFMFAGIVYATTWPSGGPPLAAPGDGNVDLNMGSLWDTDGTNTYIENGRVGVGTTDPRNTLHVKGNGIIIEDNSADLNFWGSGTNYLQIKGHEDKIYFRAQSGGIWNWPNDSKMVIQADGNIGIGTTAPEDILEAELDQNGTTSILVENNTNDTAACSSVKVRTADSTVAFGAYPSNYTLGGLLPHLADRGNIWVYDDTSGFDIVTAAATSDLRIYTGGYAVANERMRINSNGNVGIGTTEPGAYKLYVSGAAHSTGGWSGSDERWKKSITPLADSLEKVAQMQGVNYEWRTEEIPENGFTEGSQIGLIAQEVEKIIPELVHTNDDGFKSVSYERLTAVLVEAIKEQQIQINQLKLEIADISR